MSKLKVLNRMVFSMSLFALLFCSLPTMAQAKTSVFVTIAPQQYFVEKIGGDLVDVNVFVATGADPHTYEPTPSQMAKLSKAKGHFSIGINIEEVWLPRIQSANKSISIVHTDKGIEKIDMMPHGHDDHEEHGEEGHHDEHGHDAHHEEHDHDAHHEEEHGHDHHAEKAHEEHDDHDAHHEEGHHDHEEGHHEEGHHEDEHHAEGHHDHDHDGLDPHIWLDPVRVRQVAMNVCRGLIAMDPAHEAVYTANLETFFAEIDKLHATIEKKLANIPAEQRSFLVFHPSWGYFADRYNLRQMAIEEEGNEPSPSHMAEIIEFSRENHIKVVFVQPQFSDRSAKVIASEIGATVVPLDALAVNWRENLLQASDAFVQSKK